MTSLRLTAYCLIPAATMLLASMAPGEPETSSCEEVSSEEDGFFSDMTILTGYSFSDPETHQVESASIPVIFRVPLIHKNDWPWKADTDLYSDIHMGYFIEPTHSLEVSAPVLLRISMPLWTDSVMAFVEGGSGPIYWSLNTKALGGHFNFTNQLGVGFHCSLSENMDLELCYRFSHISNAGLDTPNRGVEGHTFLLGATFHAPWAVERISKR